MSVSGKIPTFGLIMKRVLLYVFLTGTALLTACGGAPATGWSAAADSIEMVTVSPAEVIVVTDSTGIAP